MGKYFIYLGFMNVFSKLKLLRERPPKKTIILLKICFSIQSDFLNQTRWNRKHDAIYHQMTC